MEKLNSNDKIEQLNDSINTKKSFIKFTKLNKYFLFPFICPIFDMLCYYLPNTIFDNKGMKGKEFYQMIFKELAYIIGGGIPYLISNYKQKDNKENNLNNSNDKESTNNKRIDYIYNDKSIINVNQKKVYILFAVACILFATYQLTGTLNKKDFQTLLYFIFSISLFTKYILKEDIHKHQYLSLAIAFIGIIMAMIIDFLRMEKDDIINYFLLIIGSICFSLFFVFAKYFNNVYYISPYKFSFCVGIVTIIFSILGFIIYSLIKYHDLSYFNECFDISTVDKKAQKIILLILYLLCMISFQIFALSSLVYFSPTLLMITEIINPLLYAIIVHTVNEQITYFVLIVIGYIIALLASLIYNEIIILNFCGLSKNTKKYVNKRIEKEVRELNEIQYDDNCSDGENEIEA